MDNQTPATKNSPRKAYHPTGQNNRSFQFWLPSTQLDALDMVAKQENVTMAHILRREIKRVVEQARVEVEIEKVA